MQRTFPSASVTSPVMAMLENAAGRRSARENLRQFIEQAPVAVAMFDCDMRYVSASSRWLSDYRMGARDVRGLSHYEVFPEIPEAWKQAHQRGLLGETLASDGDAFPRADGSLQWVRWHIQPWHDDQGSIAGILIFAEEISEQKKTEAALVQSEERLRLAVKVACMGTFDYYPQSGQLAWSPETREQFGLGSDAAVDYDVFLRALHPDDREMVEAKISQSLDPEGSGAYSAEFRAIGIEDGKERWISAVGQVMFNDSNLPHRFIGTTIDITSAKRTLEGLIRSERLAATGRLSATIAHEIKNPLGTMEMLLHLVQPKVTDPGVSEYLQMFDKQIEALRRVTTQTLNFNRDCCEATEFKLADTVKDLLQFYAPKAILSGVSLVPRIETDGKLLGFAGDLRQVISNLLINAIDATPKGGRIVCHVSPFHDWKHAVDGFRVTVADTGSGISQSNRHRLFEPFFTTKGEAGTGLGLWVSAGIVQRAGGSLRVWSTEKAGHSGTCFSVFLPARRRFEKPQRNTAADK